MAGTGAGLEGIIATDSRLCYIDGDAGILSYQGFRIETLAEQRHVRRGHFPALERPLAEAG